MTRTLSFVGVLALVFALNVSNAFAGNGNDGDDVNGNGCTENCGQGQGGQGGNGGNGGQGGQGQGGQGGNGQGGEGHGGNGVGVGQGGDGGNGVGNGGAGGVGNGGRSDVDVDTTVVSATTSSAKTEVDTRDTNVNGQSQSGFNAQKNGDFSGDIFTVQGDTTLVEAPKIPVNSAAASIGGNCNQGVAFTNDNASFSAGSGNPVCDLLAVARGYAAIGDMEATRGVLVQAEKAARFRAFFGYIRTGLTLGLL